VKKKIIKILQDSMEACSKQHLLDLKEFRGTVDLENTKDPQFGDYASNIAMVLASVVRDKPRKIAQVLVDHLSDPERILEKVEIAGPGFMNFFVRDQVWAALLKEISMSGQQYGRSDLGVGRRVQVEFVSANPTGPLHIGHARGAVIGDVIANILTAAGFSVSKEYYINDVGKQMNTLGKSVHLRYRELCGMAAAFPEDHYRGEYIYDLAREILEKHGRVYLDKTDPETIGFFTRYAADSILEGIKEDLASFGVSFDLYFSERELYRDNGVFGLLDQLKTKGYVYQEEETTWFKTTAFGDEKDRVVVRETGEPTYFAADIAYHKNKLDRGFDMLVDIWGADHHGYIPRVKAAIQAMEKDPEALKIILVQLVSLLRGGKPVAMSTRAGEFVTLREVIDEVGKDAARYNFLMRRSDSHLDFDLELAKKQSNENPVYYVQYAHARIRSIIRTAAERGFQIPAYGAVDLRLLTVPEEIALIKTIIRYPEVVDQSARVLEPHRFTFYLNDLASIFHSYYNKNRVISEDAELSKARLFLVECIGIVLRNALSILGVKTPEKM
jgi:arginyl-tRNA synthetase